MLKALSISAAGLFRRKCSRISVRVMPFGRSRYAWRISSAVESPSAAPKMNRADPSQYHHTASARLKVFGSHCFRTVKRSVKTRQAHRFSSVTFLVLSPIKGSPPVSRMSVSPSPSSRFGDSTAPEREVNQVLRLSAAGKTASSASSKAEIHSAKLLSPSRYRSMMCRVSRRQTSIALPEVRALTTARDSSVAP
jgi:hypothetical protein